MQTYFRRMVPPERLAVLAVPGILVLFFATRLPLFFLRDAFFDELFTIWITSKPVAGIVEALRHDSGPPLYYVLVRTARLLCDSFASPLTLARSTALLFGLGSLLLILCARSLGTSRWIAAAFLAVYFPAVYFSTEARSYALCALLIGVGSLSLMKWVESLDRRALIAAVASFVLAAWSHYYGVLFFPLPAILGLSLRRRAASVSGVLASLLCGALFVPGFLLAFTQPEEAIGWMREGGRLIGLADALFLQRLGPASPYPAVFAADPSLVLQLVSLVLVLSVLVWRTPRSPRGWIFAAITVIPWMISMALALLGRPSYFPMRFESVLAIPLALWWGESLQSLPRRARAVIAAVLILLGLYVTNLAVLDHASRRPDDFRLAARAAWASIPADAVVVASGYTFLETSAQTAENWSPVLRAFPREQASHPGWRAEISPDQIPAEVDAVLKGTGEFFWIGDGGSGELEVLSHEAALVLLFRSGPVFVVRGVRKPDEGGSGGTSAPIRE